MTSIAKDRLSNEILANLNYFNDAKNSGVKVPKILATLEIGVGALHANQVSRGLKTEQDVDNFENELPDANYFNNKNDGLDVAKKEIIQTHGVALLSADKLNKTVSFSRIR